MIKNTITLATLVLAMGFAAQAGAKEHASSSSQAKSNTAANAQATQANVDQVIAGWMAEPREVAQTMIKKYGLPNELTSQRMIWHRNGQWKLTELVNQEIDHDFPKPHKDMLRQVIAYDVPVDKFDELATFDGSVIAERTKGELAARCDKEEMNLLALNLANDVVTGKRSVDEARNEFAKTAMKFMQGESSPYTSGLQFTRPVSDEAGDSDKPSPLLKDAMKDKSKK